jgi:hypothetical protein
VPPEVPEFDVPEEPDPDEPEPDEPELDEPEPDEPEPDPFAPPEVPPLLFVGFSGPLPVPEARDPSPVVARLLSVPEVATALPPALLAWKLDSVPASN